MPMVGVPSPAAICIRPESFEIATLAAAIARMPLRRSLPVRSRTLDPPVAQICATGGSRVRDLTGSDLRNGILAMAAASVAISNDSGLMHIAAGLGTPTMGIFGPTSPYLWAPLNGLAATVVTKTQLSCQPCQRTVCTMNDHRCMRDISATEVVGIAQRVLNEAVQASP